MGAFLDKPITEKHTEYEESKTMEGVRYSVSSMQGWRAHMEDSHVHKLSLSLTGSQSSLSDPLSDVSLFAVFDGHGGDYIAKNSADITVKTFLESFKKPSAKENPNESIKLALTDAFLTMDERMKELPKIKSGEDSSGCTAVCAALTKDAYIIANAGDSRCIVIGENAQVKFSSKDHKPDLPEETDRISKAGGYVSMRRVNGDLAVSRGLGDYIYKRNQTLPAENQQVSPLPDVSIIERSATDLFLVVACDGIWDVISNEECGRLIFDYIKSGFNLNQCAENLIEHCLELNSRDNMSVIIVALPAVDKIPKRIETIPPAVIESMEHDSSEAENSESNKSSLVTNSEDTSMSSPTNPRKGATASDSPNRKN